MRILIIAVFATLCLASPARAEYTAADAVRAHLEAIIAEDYTGADDFFSAAFIRAFKADVARLNEYYIVRREQLGPGYTVGEPVMLNDQDHTTARVTVDFNDPSVDSPLQVTERIHYYLVREKATGPQLANTGFAWRIDIFDALSYDSLADARRRPYLYTREAWEEDASRELRSLQGLYRIQSALHLFYQKNGEFPFRLLGSDNRRDELVSGKYMGNSYPKNGFTNDPMRSIELGKHGKGEFSYYSVDADGDGRRESYWLALHGRIQDNFYFKDKDIVYLLSPDPSQGQFELAFQFIHFWFDRGEEELQFTEQYAKLQTDEISEFVDVYAMANPYIVDDTPVTEDPAETLAVSREPSEAGPPESTDAEPAGSGPPPMHTLDDRIIWSLITALNASENMGEAAAKIAGAPENGVPLFLDEPAGEAMEETADPLTVLEVIEMLKVYSFGF